MSSDRTRSLTPLNFILDVLLAGAGVLLRFWVDGVMGEGAPLITFYLPVVMAAVLGGFWNGAICTAIGATASFYFFVEPYAKFDVPASSEVMRYGFFILYGLGVSLVIEIFKRANHRAAQALQRLQVVEGELRLSNEALEHFAVVSAHDLRDPLNSIGGFLQLLEVTENWEDRQIFLQEAKKSVEKMNRLIGEIFQMSLVNTSTVSTESVDFNVILQDVLQNLEEEVKRKRAQVSCQSLPNGVGNSTLLTSLLQNLISNALKYGGNPPEVRISCEDLGDLWLFSVADNGPGLKEEDSKKIFELFERAGASSDKGAGIGLNTCKRIVEKHGGRIWMESKRGVGTYFRFTFPKTS